MQILLPYPDYEQTANALTPSILRHQVMDIITTLSVIHETARNLPMYEGHPSVMAWEGYAPQLAHFGLVCVEALQVRSLQAAKYRESLDWHLDTATSGEYSMDKPAWFGSPKLHRSHKSVLIRIDPLKYRRIWPSVPANLPEVFPYGSHR